MRNAQFGAYFLLDIDLSFDYHAIGSNHTADLHLHNIAHNQISTPHLNSLIVSPNLALVYFFRMLSDNFIVQMLINLWHKQKQVCGQKADRIDDWLQDW